MMGDAQGVAVSNSNAPDASAPDVRKPVQPVSVDHIRVRADRIELTVRVADARYRTTDEPLAQRFCERRPSLARHACRNERGLLFGHVMSVTSVPHLFEHLIIDFQTHAAEDGDRVFTGTTQWSADDPLVATVAVSFEDDLVALESINKALDLLNFELLQQRG